MTIALFLAALAAVAGVALVTLGVVAQRRRSRAAADNNADDDADDDKHDRAARESAARLRQVLDAVHTPRPTTIELPAPSGPPPVERYRLLIVDDDVRAGRTVARLLGAHDTVVVAGSGAALAGLASDAGFDAILCALTMAGMSGVAFAQAIAERYPALRSRLVFLVSASSTPETQRLLALSEVRWVTKPVQYAKLAICVGEVVDAARRSDPARRTSATRVQRR